MTPETSAAAVDVDPWLAAEYPLSVQELTRLSHLRTKIQAAQFLDARGQLSTMAQGQTTGVCRFSLHQRPTVGVRRRGPRRG